MMIKPSRDGICVAIRMRPLNEREITSGQENIFKCVTDQNAIVQMKDGQIVEGVSYAYDKVFNGTASTNEVYSHIAEDIVEKVVQGVNGTIFACKCYFSLYLQFFS